MIHVRADACFRFRISRVVRFCVAIVIYSIRSNHKKKMATYIAEDGRIETQALEEELIEVKERVAVLERIVTDGQYDLNREIRRLESV